MRRKTRRPPSRRPRCLICGERGSDRRFRDRMGVMRFAHRTCLENLTVPQYMALTAALAPGGAPGPHPAR